jgi:CubicO group peptidase (beta-lactamase class C family)
MQAFRTAPEYSNMMVALAGRVAEKVTGKTFETLVREEIFEPLGMTLSGFTSDGVEGVVVPYGLMNESLVALDREILQ